MKRIQKRMLLQIIIGFFLGRVELFGMNPVGVSYFASGFTEGGSIIAVGISIFLGMLSKGTLEQSVLYTAAMFALWLSSDLLTRYSIRIRKEQAVGIVSGTVLVLSVIQMILLPWTWNTLFYVLAEFFLIVLFSVIFSYGIHFLLYSKKGQGLGNEEMISLVFLGFFAVYGIPDCSFIGISLVKVVTYFFILFMGYRYGMSVGAVTGLAGGMIFVFLYDSQAEVLTVLCFIGILAGLLREQGKVWMLSAVLVATLAVEFVIDGINLSLEEMKEIAIACTIIILVPERYMQCVSTKAFGWERDCVQEDFKSTIRKRLADFSESFRNLSKTLVSRERQSFQLNQWETRKLVEQLTEQTCGRCQYYTNCMGPAILKKPSVLSIFTDSQQWGKLNLEQMPVEFLQNCQYPEQFVAEVNKSIRTSRIVMGYHNRLVESHEVLASQLAEVSSLVQKLSKDVEDVECLPEGVENELLRHLRSAKLRVTDLIIYEKKGGRIEVRFRACTVRKRLVTAKEAAKVIGSVLKRHMKPSQSCRAIIPKTMTSFCFVEDTPLYALTGVARKTKEGEKVSGDSFSCLSLPCGELLLALSDGMGSGDHALEESQTVIELLEQMAEAGFSKMSAIKLINSLYLSEREDNGYATMDLAIINLFHGACQFIKNGASTTYLQHGKKIERIESQSLPVGVFSKAEPFLENRRISAGDYVIMMTDGVSECFEQSEDAVECLLTANTLKNPQDIADMILDKAVALQNKDVADDMSVIVAGIWERSPHYEKRDRKWIGRKCLQKG